MTFYLLSLGCPKNLVDSEKLTKRLRHSGHRQVSGPGEADVLMVNTCGFIEAAKDESIEEILRLARIKEGRRLLVLGCLSQRYGNELQAELPEVDAMWGVEAGEEIARYIDSNYSGEKTGGPGGNRLGGKTRTTAPSFRPSTFPSAYLKISEGCGRRCSFCSIPLIRGPLRNFEPEDILREAEEQIRAGVKELILVSQDTTSYSVKGYRLHDLLKDICGLAGDFWVRLHYLHPSGIDRELLEAMAGEPKAVKYLDMPLQHSSPRILRLMARGGSGSSFKRTISHARKMMPELAVRTTFIVGFPGESEEEFEGLLNFIGEAAFDHAGAFVYSREEGTPAARLQGQLPRALKKRRLDRLMKTQAAISLEKNMVLPGREMTALVDEAEDGVAVGRLASQSPDVDGVIFIENEDGALKAGDFTRVLVTKAYDYDLEAVPARGK